MGNAAPYVWYDEDYNYWGSQDTSYVLSPSEVEKILEKRKNHEYFAGVGILTKEMLEYWAYAASGRKWELQDIKDVINMGIIGNEFWTEQIGDEYILIYRGDAGVIEWVDLENITSEYTGAGKWNVSAECIYYGLEINIQMADVTFTVIRNPDSCFDGYSITGINITPTDNSGWAKAYYDYLVGGDIVSDCGLEWEDCSYCHIQLCYIDEDNIPEMYVLLEQSMTIYEYNNGQVKLLIKNSAKNVTLEWIEKENRIRESISEGGDEVYNDEGIYIIVDGELQLIAGGHLIIEYNLVDEGFVEEAEWNNIAVTEEEYYILRNEVFDETRIEKISDKFDDISSALDFLQSVINAAP